MFKISCKNRIIIFLFSILFLLPSSSLANLKEYTLGPHDVVSIEIWDHQDLSRETLVSPKGTISFPLVGEIKVEGLTSEQLQKIITNALDGDYLINPQVTVNIREYNSKKIYVLGEVERAGSYPFTKATTLVELISMAGGLADDARHEVYILRQKEAGATFFSTPRSGRTRVGRIALEPEKLADHIPAILNPGPPSENDLNCEIITINLNDFSQGINLTFKLKNNDTLFIPKAEFFYVTGEVQSPGRFKLETELTVLQGISMAGGLTRKASDKKVKIIRMVNNEKREIRADMDDWIIPNDIIKIQESFF